MISIEPKISALVESQFPDFYRDEGPMFVAFMKAYYEWLESDDQVNYHTRRLADYRDIDKTTDDFIVHFKEKYLRNIQFQTESNKRLFIKHALDFYRAKGTERATDLFFKLVYGVPAAVYYPGDDIFKLSAGEWTRPVYLEVTPSSRNMGFIGKGITGLSSGATAFVDDYVVRRAKNKFIHVFFLSNISGNFSTGEILAVDNDFTDCPNVAGSLTSIDVLDGGTGFNVGETVNFVSNNGAYGKALVANTEDVAGTVSFELDDGGFGYSSNSEVLISNSVMTVTGISNNAFTRFETVRQDLVRLTYANANGTFANGQTINKFYANNLMVGTGKIVTMNTSSLTVSVASGNLQLGTANIYTTGNTIWANVSAYVVVTATANLIAQGSNVSLIANSYTGLFSVGEIINQSNSSGSVVATGIVKTVTPAGSNVVLTTTNANGVFKTGLRITGASSGKTANVISYGNKVGVRSVTNTFYSNGYIVGLTSSTNGTIGTITAGAGAGFTLGSNTTFTYLESSNTNIDVIETYANTLLDATAFGFPATPTANVTSPIQDALTFLSINYGKIANASITLINPGSGYTDSPMVVVYDPRSYSLGKKDYDLTFSNATGTFVIGEVIKQCNSTGGVYANGASGIITSGNTSSIHVKRTKVANSFTTANVAQSYITGVSSNTVAFLNTVSNDLSSESVGINALIDTNASYANGSVVSLEVINSGFGYVENEDVIFYKTGNASISGIATLHLGRQGLGTGYYRETGGVLSGTKKLHDGDYYQEYSYEIQTEFPLERYADMFKKVAHVAGTKLFGAYVTSSEVHTPLDANDSAIFVYGNNQTTVVQTTVAGANVIGVNTAFSNLFSNGDFIILRYQRPSSISVAGIEATGNATLTFNGRTQVSNVDNFIAPTTQPLSNGDMVRYHCVGSALVGGLKNLDLYYVVQANSTGFRLSSTQNGSPITLTALAVSSTHRFYYSSVAVPSVAQVGDLAVLVDVAEHALSTPNASFNALSDVSNTNKTITFSNNRFVNNALVLYGVAAGNTAVGGIANDGVYFVVNTTFTTLQLATSANGTPISLVSSVSETGHTLRHVEITPETNTPGGWTQIYDGNSPANTTSGGLRSVVSYKILENSDLNSRVGNGMIHTTDQTTNYGTSKYIAVLRSTFQGDNVNAYSIDLSNVNYEFTSGNPAAQVIASGGNETPMVAFAVYNSSVAGTSSTESPAMTLVSNGSSNATHTLAYKIFNPGDAVSNVTVDLADGGLNQCLSFYIQPKMNELTTEKRILRVVNNSLLVTTGPLGFVSNNANYAKITLIGTDE